MNILFIRGDNRLLLFHCVLYQVKEGEVVNIPFPDYETIAKDATVE